MSYDVVPHDLRAGATHLRADAAAIDGGCNDAYGGVETAGSGVNAGPLVAALADLSHAVAEVSRMTGSAVRAAGERLSENADRYGTDDAAASARLGRSVPEGGYAPPVFSSIVPAPYDLGSFGPRGGPV